MEVIPKKIELYMDQGEEAPFEKWLLSLHDKKTIALIQNRLEHVAKGNMGDCKSLGEGVFELRIHYGPGYRVYFGQTGLTLVILLCGGEKRTQWKDIEKARKYWADYQIRSSL